MKNEDGDPKPIVVEHDLTQLWKRGWLGAWGAVLLAFWICVALCLYVIREKCLSVASESRSAIAAALLGIWAFIGRWMLTQANSGDPQTTRYAQGDRYNNKSGGFGAID